MSEGSLRLDKWLWFARFFRSRSQATALCLTGRVRVNEILVRKAHHALHPGDVLTFPQGPHIRVIKVVALGTRRGPAPEAQSLYEDLDPPVPRSPKADTDAGTMGSRTPGSGRPTKAQRRATDRLINKS